MKQLFLISDWLTYCRVMQHNYRVHKPHSGKRIRAILLSHRCTWISFKINTNRQFLNGCFGIQQTLKPKSVSMIVNSRISSAYREVSRSLVKKSEVQFPLIVSSRSLRRKELPVTLASVPASATEGCLR